MKLIAQNPVIFTDMPDPDVIRVNNTYYMISTTMHFMPGGVILRSYNLKDWEICSHLYDKLEDYPAARMEDGTIYGSGMWAGSLRYHNGRFYALHIANDTHRSYLYTSENAEGPWEQTSGSAFYYDPGLFFDDDGTPYVVHGNRHIKITELEKDCLTAKEGGLNKEIICDDDSVRLGHEGSHLYKINGKYYLFTIHWPSGGMRTECCFVTDKLEGPWKGKEVLSHDMGYCGQGVAQGGLVDTPDGKWYGMLFQDRGAAGRMPILVDVNFENDFPVFGKNGCVSKEIEVFDLNPNYKYASLSDCDSFSYDEGNPVLKKVWEWNHIPDNKNWKIRGGNLVITNQKGGLNPVNVQNVLTQRLVGFKPRAVTFIDGSLLEEGDVAGLCAFQSNYVFGGITKENGKYYFVGGKKPLKDGKPEYSRNDTTAPEIFEKIELSGSKVQIKLNFDFTDMKDLVTVQYREKNDDEWKLAGKPFKLYFQLDHFTGTRAGLFVYGNKNGGDAVFEEFFNTEI